MKEHDAGPPSGPAFIIDAECPHCGYKVDRSAQIFGDIAPPEDGDISICFKCGKVGIFEKGNTRKPTLDELEESLHDRRVTEAQIIRSTIDEKEIGSK